MSQSDDQTPIEQVTPRELQPQPIAARAGSYYRNVRYVLALLMLGAGIWLLRDGFSAWPARNAEYDRLASEQRAAETAGDSDRAAKLSQQLKDHGDRKGEFDIKLQKILGIVFIPASIVFFFYFMNKSRGELRLADDTLHIPGHPPIPLANVTSLDSTKWDRKGIAFLDYELPGGERGSVRLDDFIYDRKPTDAIHDHIVADRAAQVPPT